MSANSSNRTVDLNKFLTAFLPGRNIDKEAKELRIFTIFALFDIFRIVHAIISRTIFLGKNGT